MKPVKLHLLGGFELVLKCGPALSTRKAEALLAYLAVPEGRAHRRDKLASLLWSDRSDVQARHSLAQSVYVIRKALGESGKDALISNAHSVALKPSFIDVDVNEFEALAAQSSPEAHAAAIRLYRGELLDGVSIREQAFQDWLLGEQRRLNTIALGTLEQLLDHQLAAGDDKVAIETARKLLALDPLRENIHRTLMRLNRRAGHEAAAICQYQICAEVLRRELDIEPDAATKALYREIVGDRTVPAGSARPTSLPARVTPIHSRADKPLVAVLPFTCSDSSAQGRYREAITEEIIVGLSKVSGFSVTSLDSAFARECNNTDMRQLAHELGVRFILKGSLRRSGADIRVNSQLVDAPSGSHLWADHYDIESENIFALDPIAESIVATVAVTLTRTEQNRAMRNEARILPAYDYALRGAAYNHRLTNEDSIKAKEMYRRAIALDPDYAPTHVGLGSVLTHQAIFGWCTDRQKSLNAAFDHAKRALVLDNSLARAHTVLGASYLFSQHNALAVAEGRRAVMLEPSNADVLVSHAYFLAADGQGAAAVEVARKALRFNPANTNWLYSSTLCTAHYLVKQYEAAAVMGEQSVAENPNGRGQRLRVTAAYAKSGRLDDARRHASEVLRIDPNFSLQSFSEYVPYRRKQDVDLYIEGLRKAGLPE